MGDATVFDEETGSATVSIDFSVQLGLPVPVAHLPAAEGLERIGTSSGD